MNNTKEDRGEGDETEKLKTEPKTRVKECQGYAGAQRDRTERRNGRKLQEKKSEREERRGGRCEGRRDRVRKQGSDNNSGMGLGYIFRPAWIERVNRG